MISAVRAGESLRLVEITFRTPSGNPAYEEVCLELPMTMRVDLPLSEALRQA